jgi:hypothetical protein
MTDDEREQKQYELRMKIEGLLYELGEMGFTIDEIAEFADGVVSDMREAEET